MQITLSDEQVKLLHDFIVPINHAHLDEQCEPPGYSIEISFAGPYGCDAVGRCGGRTVELGPVSVQPDQPHWAPTTAGA